MFRRSLLVVPVLCVVYSCQPVPLTGRKQLSLIPASQLTQLGADSYQQFLAQKEVIEGTQESRMVKRVGRAIARAVETYLTRNKMGERVQEFDWEFNLIADTTVNAFAMPGGKVAVFSGIMEVARDEDGLAVIMGHEIAHVIARHGNERMSQALLFQLGAVALSVALANEPQRTRRLFLAAYGLGGQVGVLLPYSRLHESEADRLGLIFMAMAGYNPRAAVAFWQRMEEATPPGAAPPEFLSTHPSHDTRIENIRDHLPQALEYYRQAQQTGVPVTRLRFLVPVAGFPSLFARLQSGQEAFCSPHRPRSCLWRQ